MTRPDVDLTTIEHLDFAPPCSVPPCSAAAQWVAWFKGADGQPSCPSLQCCGLCQGHLMCQGHLQPIVANKGVAQSVSSGKRAQLVNAVRL